MGAVKQIPRNFHPGEAVVYAGIYTARHRGTCRGHNELALLAGEDFPRCPSCGELVQYQLLRPAPYLHDDEDFRKP
jgi:hypothetical protein